VCPVGAIHERSEWRQVADLLDSRRKTTVAMVAPSVRVALGEELGLAPGAGSAGQVVAALRALGFDHCLDVNFAADMTILEASFFRACATPLGGFWGRWPGVSTALC